MNELLNWARFIESIDLYVLRVERASKIQKCVDTAFDC